MKNMYALLFSLTILSGCVEVNLPGPTDPVDLYPDDGVRPSSIIHDGGPRGYQLYTPPGYNGIDPLPVVFNFHGYGGDAYQYLLDADMRSIASAKNFFMVYPQAGYCDGGLAWNPSLLGGNNKCDLDDLGFIEALIDSLSAEFQIDSSKIYACGYSNGGMMAMGLAMQKSELFAAVGSVSGTMLDFITPSHPMPAIIIHGTNDYVLPYLGNSDYNSVQSQIDFWTNFNNTDTIPIISSEVSNDGIITDRYQYTQGDNDVAVEHYKIINGEHVWRMPDPLAGNPTDNTGLVLWEFFKNYSL
jgi:polyhydroxybutyrate depolymerase